MHASVVRPVQLFRVGLAIRRCILDHLNLLDEGPVVGPRAQPAAPAEPGRRAVRMLGTLPGGGAGVAFPRLATGWVLSRVAAPPAADCI